MKITSTVKGLITGLIMLSTALALYYSKVPPQSNYHYLVYAVYALGISWTLISYQRSPAFAARFKDLFSQGFRCFVVVALIMVSFTGIFSRMNPEFAEEEAKAYKEYHMEQRGKTSKTPSQIDEEAEQLKKQYTVRLVSEAIFGYLVIGVIMTSAVAGLILITRKQ
jgi:hypothetical protein